MEEDKILRKCCACSNIKSRNDLIKITVNKKNNELRILPDSKFFGRSVYICKNIECISNAFKKGRIFKLLKTKPDDSLKEKIEEKIRTVLEQ